MKKILIIFFTLLTLNIFSAESYKNEFSKLIITINFEYNFVFFHEILNNGDVKSLFATTFETDGKSLLFTDGKTNYEIIKDNDLNNIELIIDKNVVIDLKFLAIVPDNVEE